MKYQCLTASAQRDQSGVTLIELMVVVVIIGVLAAIAYPAYRNYGKQTRRSDAQIALTRVAAAQEKFYSDCGYYAQTLEGARGCGATAADGILGSAAAGKKVLSPERDYVVSILAPTGGCPIVGCFVLQATPATSADDGGTAGVGTGRQAGDGNYRIDARGSKTWAKDGTNYNHKWTDK